MGNVDWPVRLIFNSITWKKKKKRTVTGKFKKNSTKKKQIYEIYVTWVIFIVIYIYASKIELDQYLQWLIWTSQMASREKFYVQTK